MPKIKKIKVNSERVKMWLAYRGIDQKKLSERIDMDYIGVNRAINKGEMSEDMFNRICETLFADPRDLQRPDLVDSIWGDGSGNQVFLDYTNYKLFDNRSEILEKAVDYNLLAALVDPDTVPMEHKGVLSAIYRRATEDYLKEKNLWPW